MIGSVARGAVFLALGAFISAPGVSAQAQGVSTVQCLPSFAWANNSLQQNPCLVDAYLLAQCSAGSYTISPLKPGYHYGGPTNETVTQTPCICSTPAYMLAAACGACQNRTWASWTSWSTFCPASIIPPQGEYSQIIPSGTRVPRWAYLKPSDYGDFFRPEVAEVIGDLPESSQVPSSTSSALSTTSTTPASTTSADIGATQSSSSTSPTSSSTSRSGGGGGGGSNTGAIAGGVVGGVLGLALIALLGFFVFRHVNKPKASGGLTGHNNDSADGGKLNPEMAAAGAGVPSDQRLSYLPNQSTGPTVGSGSGSSGYYNTNSSSFPPAQAPQYGGYQNPQPQGRYSGMPEI